MTNSKSPISNRSPASYLYTDNDGSHFLDQETFDTLTLNDQMIGNALDYLVEGAVIQLQKYNGNPIGLELPMYVELAVTYTGPGTRGDTSSGTVTKLAKLKPAAKSAFPSSSKKAKRSRSQPKTADSRAARKQYRGTGRKELRDQYPGRVG